MITIKIDLYGELTLLKLRVGSLIEEYIFNENVLQYVYIYIYYLNKRISPLVNSFYNRLKLYIFEYMHNTHVDRIANLATISVENIDVN